MVQGKQAYWFCLFTFSVCSDYLKFFFFKEKKKHPKPWVTRFVTWPSGPFLALSGVLHPTLCVLSFSNTTSIKITLKTYRLFFSESDLQTGQNNK